MDDLIAFLKARLDEDERVAKAAVQGPWYLNSESYAETIYGADDIAVVAGGKWGGEASVFASDEDAIHIARWDPARVLAEVEAKRRIIARHQSRQSGRWKICMNCRPIDPEYPDHLTEAVWPCPDLRDAAAPYADHPDYQQEWRP